MEDTLNYMLNKYPNGKEYEAMKREVDHILAVGEHKNRERKGLVVNYIVIED